MLEHEFLLVQKMWLHGELLLRKAMQKVQNESDLEDASYGFLVAFMGERGCSFCYSWAAQRETQLDELC